MFDLLNDPNFLPITLIFIGLIIVAIWQKLDKFILPLSVVYVMYLIYMFITLPSENEEGPIIITDTITDGNEKETLIVAIEDESVYNDTVAHNLKLEEVIADEPVKNEEPPDLRVNLIKMCQAIIDSLRKPINISDSFPISLKRVYCYSRIRNALSQREILYEWYFQNKLVDIIPIKIGRSVNWRSWTYKSTSDSQIGEWYVVIRDQITGTSLDTAYFIITDE